MVSLSIGIIIQKKKYHTWGQGEYAKNSVSNDKRKWRNHVNVISEILDNLKGTNLRIVGLEDGLLTALNYCRKFIQIRNELDSQVKEAYRISKRLENKGTYAWCVIVNMLEM